MTQVYTYTLTSSNILVVPIQVDFGEIITAGVFAGLLAALIIDISFRLVYR